MAPAPSPNTNGSDAAFGPPIAARVNENFGVPRLTSDEYAALFTAIEQYFGGEADFELSRTSLVRDALAARGYSISRHAVNFVVKGIYYSGHDFNADVPQDASTLALAFLSNVKNLIRREGLEANAEDETALELWLTGATSPVEPGVVETSIAPAGADLDRDGGAMPYEQTDLEHAEANRTEDEPSGDAVIPAESPGNDGEQYEPRGLAAETAPESGDSGFSAARPDEDAADDSASLPPR